MSAPEPFATIDVACPECGEPQGPLRLYRPLDLNLGLLQDHPGYYVQIPEINCAGCGVPIRAVVTAAEDRDTVTHRIILARSTVAVHTPLGWM